ncbi:MAG: hypothetical protein HYU66_14585, partial [Armatimonadetes bacterium]|nr:hypothetical protein [Armatimonadota bacterium]
MPNPRPLDDPEYIPITTNKVSPIPASTSPPPPPPPPPRTAYADPIVTVSPAVQSSALGYTVKAEIVPDNQTQPGAGATTLTGSIPVGATKDPRPPRVQLTIPSGYQTPYMAYETTLARPSTTPVYTWTPI